MRWFVEVRVYNKDSKKTGNTNYLITQSGTVPPPAKKTPSKPSRKYTYQNFLKRWNICWVRSRSLSLYVVIRLLYTTWSSPATCIMSWQILRLNLRHLGPTPWQPTALNAYKSISKISEKSLRIICKTAQKVHIEYFKIYFWILQWIIAQKT